MKAPLITRNNRIALTVGVALGAVASSHPVYAQDVAAEDEPSEEAAAPANSIVVTGSRIRSVTPFNSPDPIVVLGSGKPDDAERTGA